LLCTAPSIESTCQNIPKKQGHLAFVFLFLQENVLKTF
jgi:hypothetical protein